MHKNIQLKFKSNHYWLIAIAIGGAISAPNIIQHQAKMAQIRTDIAIAESKAQKLERSLEFEQRQAEVANKRYESCLPVVGETYRNQTHYFAGLKEGDIPTDRITKQPFAKGTVVCDAHGLTGVIDESGRVSNVAFTGDRDKVQKRLQRFRGSQYSQPVLGEK